MTNDKPSIRLRVMFGGKAMLGPGKADLLEQIRQTGSISAAGKRMGMSYKRAWMLVETLNTIFKEPLVESSRGGSSGGGTRLTQTGEIVVKQYRKLEAKASVAGRQEIANLQELLLDISSRK